VFWNDLSCKNGSDNVTGIKLGTTRTNSHNRQLALLRNPIGLSNLKSSRRGKFDIIAEILLLCDQKKTKTSIMYNTNLKYSQLKSHMHTLTAQWILVKSQNKYNTIEKGYRLIEFFTQLNDLLDKFNPKKAQRFTNAQFS